MKPHRTVVFIVVLMISWVKCMNLREVLDFNTFLEKTSFVDRPRIDGVALEGDEDSTSVQSEEDDAPHPDAWEQSGKFEGDIILNARQRRLIVEDVAEGLSRNGLKDITKRWPDNEVVFYIQKEHFSSGHVQAIMDGMDDIARSSCITFRPYKKGDPDAVVIQGSRRGCFSAVGYQSGYQVLNLSARHPLGRGCFRHGTVVHEMLHTLGFYHMQSSPDRDDYIDVKWDNIHEGAKHNFRKYNTFSVTDFGIPYDYESVLHYSKRAFSINGQPTLVPKKGGAEIGQRRGMSDSDTQKLNKMYCDKDSGSSSFDDPKNALKKSAIKDISDNNKPFEGHGLGYYMGKSIIVKLPQLETIELKESNVVKLLPQKEEVKNIRTKENRPTLETLNLKDNDADDEFIDISKYLSDYSYPTEISFDEYSEDSDKSVESSQKQINNEVTEMSKDNEPRLKHNENATDFTKHNIKPETYFDEYPSFRSDDMPDAVRSKDVTKHVNDDDHDSLEYTPTSYGSKNNKKYTIEPNYNDFSRYSIDKPQKLVIYDADYKSPKIANNKQTHKRTRNKDPADDTFNIDPEDDTYNEDDTYKHIELDYAQQVEKDESEAEAAFSLFNIPEELKDWWSR